MDQGTFVGVRGRWLLALLPLLIPHHHAQRPPLQAAVLADGFAFRDGRDITAVDRAGATRMTVTLPFDHDARVIGASSLLGIGWHEGDKVKLLAYSEPAEVSTWGKRVKRLCEGVATNDQQFGVSWLEADGRIWVVHGPTTRQATALEAGDALEASTAAPSWCGVASAADKIVLLWRDGDRVFMNHCSKKSCASIAPKVPIEKKAALVGFGCTKNACLFAQRTNKGTALVLSSESGRAKWTKLLDGVTGDRIAITGAGDRALAVAYESSAGGAEVRRYDVKTGTASTVWRDPAAHGLPAIAWAADKLLVAHRHGDSVAPQVVNLPR